MGLSTFRIRPITPYPARLQRRAFFCGNSGKRERPLLQRTPCHPFGTRIYSLAMNDFPILDFDPDPEAFISASDFRQPVVSGGICLMAYFPEVVEKIVTERKLAPFVEMKTEMGRIPIYLLSEDPHPIALINPIFGSPGAAVTIEALIAWGFDRILVCGSAGVLQPEILGEHFLVPDLAIRDEGTSYHYLHPDDLASPDAHFLQRFRGELDRQKIPYLTGCTWTTDAFYRETRGRILKRKAQGAICVEMEMSACFAVAQFKKIPLAGILFGGDSLGGQSWDKRNWKTSSDRELLVRVCLDAAQGL